MRRFFLPVLVILLLGLQFIPVSYERIIREGTDRFETHHALWGKRVKTVSSTAEAPIRSVGLMLVNMRQAASVAPAHVSVSVANRGEIAAGEMSVVGDDTFAWFHLAPEVVASQEEYTIAVSAPRATQEFPVGVRFDEESTDLALIVREKVSMHEYALRWKAENPDISRTLIMMVFGGTLLAIFLFFLDVLFTASDTIKRSAWKNVLWICSLTLLFICTVAMRVPLANAVDSSYGGDAFNYLLKSRALIDGEDPFAADPRKAPLYSFLVSPGLADPFDAVTWERWVSMFAAAGAVVLVALFLRKVNVPHSLALAGGVLLAVNRDFQFESVQGLANTLYVFLILLSAYVFFIGRTYLVAVVTALATLTRYEGGAVAALLLPVSMFIEKHSIRRKLRALIPFSILLLIPFLMLPFSETLGVRTVSDIRGDEGLYVAYSMEDFSSNFIGFKHFFGRLWVLTPHIGKPFVALGFGVALGLAGAFIGARFGLVQHIRPFIPYGVIFFILAVVIRGAAEQADYLVQLFAFLAGVGVGTALWRFPKQSIPILLMILVQVIAITAILPKSRYYLPIVPFIALGITGGVYVFVTGTKSHRFVFGPLLCVCMIASFTYANAKDALIGQVSDYNEKSAGQTVLLNAARFMKHREGVLAAVEESDLQFRTYLFGDQLVIFPDHLRDIDAQYAKLKESEVSYISETTENPYFEKLIFAARWADVSSVLYRVY